MDTIIKIHLSVILGILIPIPFGNVIIPYIYWRLHKNDGEQLSKQACNILNFQLLASLVFYISLTIIWFYFIQLLKGNKVPDYVIMGGPILFFLCISVIYPIIIAIYIYTHKKIKTFYPNIISIFNKK